MEGWFYRHLGELFLLVVIGGLFAVFLWHGIRERKKPWFRKYERRRRHMTVGEKISEFSLEMVGGAVVEVLLWAIGAGLIALLAYLVGLWR